MSETMVVRTSFVGMRFMPDWRERVALLAKALAEVQTSDERAAVYRSWQLYGGHGDAEFEVYTLYRGPGRAMP